MSWLGKVKTANKPQSRGRLVVLDGIDGSGKTTQIDRLRGELGAAGYSPETIRFPVRGKYSGGMLDAYLAGNFGALNPYAASTFFAMDRFEAMPIIEQWLGQGKVVLCEGYITANAARQGAMIADPADRTRFFKWLDNLEYGIYGLPRPDLTMVLNVPAAAATQLLSMRDRASSFFPREAADRLHASHQVYLEIAGIFPNTKLIECVENNELMPPELIGNKVWEMVRRIALKDFAPVFLTG